MGLYLSGAQSNFLGGGTGAESTVHDCLLRKERNFDQIHEICISQGTSGNILSGVVNGIKITGNFFRIMCA